MLWPSTADAKSYSLPTADVAVQIQPDGSLLVQERITFDFSGDFSGAYRDIPLRSASRSTRSRVSEGRRRVHRPARTPSSAASACPAPSASSRARSSCGSCGTTGRPTSGGRSRSDTASGASRSRTTTSSTSTSGSGGTSGRPRSARSNARMQLPRAAPLGPAYRVWGSPAWVRGVVDRAPSRGDPAGGERPGQAVRRVPRRPFRAACSRRPRARRFARATGCRRSWPTSSPRSRPTSTTASGSTTRRAIPGERCSSCSCSEQGRRSCSSAASGGRTGAKRGPGTTASTSRRPPTETEPALVPSLVRQETAPGSNEFTATLFDLIRRGRYKSTPVTTERKVWGGLRHEDVADLQLAARRHERAAHRVRGARRRGDRLGAHRRG